MSTITFSRCGYRYYLVPKEDGYYWLYATEDFALQYLRVNEQCGVIISITKGDETLIKLSQLILGHTVLEIKKEDNAYKVKLS